MEQYQGLSVGELLLSKSLGSSIQFYEIQSKSCPKELFYVEPSENGNEVLVVTLWILKQKISFCADVVVTYIQCESTTKNVYKRIYTMNVL